MKIVTPGVNDFHGYQGKCIFLANNNIHKGHFVLGKDFKTKYSRDRG